MTLRRLAPLLVALALVLAACASSGGSAADGLPDVELEFVDGGPYTVAGATAEPRVLNLWATWCAPCRAELPIFDEVAAATDDIDIIGINVGDSGEQATELIEELDLGFPQVLDPEGRIQRTLRITGMPSTIFISEAGEVLDIHAGEVDRSELLELLAEHYPDSPSVAAQQAS